jgi:hypothetical protein
MNASTIPHICLLLFIFHSSALLLCACDSFQLVPTAPRPNGASFTLEKIREMLIKERNETQDVRYIISVLQHQLRSIRFDQIKRLR